MKRQDKIAVLIDAENVSKKYSNCSEPLIGIL